MFEGVLLGKRRGGPSAFRAGGWREAKWATFTALCYGRKFWFSRGDRVKRTRPFWFRFWGNAKKNK